MKTRDKALAIAKITETRRSTTTLLGKTLEQLGFKRLEDFGYGWCNHVVPWTLSANDLDAEVMILGHDWASAGWLEIRKDDPAMALLGRDLRLPSNKNLDQLLKKHLGLRFCNTYATDIVPFIKMTDGMIGAVDAAAIKECARLFAIPQIEIVSPRVVICLGRDAFRAIVRALDLSTEKGPDIEFLEYKGARIFAVTHTASSIGTERRRKSGAVDREWSEIARFLAFAGGMQ
jgi:restriction system protein